LSELLTVYDDEAGVYGISQEILREVERRKTAMRRILIVDDDPLVGQAMHGRSGNMVAGSLRLAARLGAIDDCLPEAEPHRRIAAALDAVAAARSGPQGSDGVERRNWKSQSETQGTRVKHASS
jgi:hypothetical protein